MTHHSSLPVDAGATHNLILHHYPGSPFAEKIRRVLGHKRLAWKSVVIPMVMPKPDVLALTGGYRKTPILQIGADIYCDTALICDVLEQLQPTPTLYPVRDKGAARLIAQWADITLFWSAMGYSFTAAGAAQIFTGAPPETGKVFAEDRAKMRLAVPRVGPADAAAAYKSYLRRLANMLEDQSFLLGPEASVADFAAYHPLWFTRHCTSVMAGILDATPSVLAWMDRIAAIASTQANEIQPREAISIAASATPAALHDAVFQDDHGIPLGSQVTIASDSFGPEPTSGELIAATRMHYTLRRADERAGAVHVHFPRIGYVMRAVQAA
jgi:glutathione S-transferase